LLSADEASRFSDTAPAVLQGCPVVKAIPRVAGVESSVASVAPRPGRRPQAPTQQANLEGAAGQECAMAAIRAAMPAVSSMSRPALTNTLSTPGGVGPVSPGCGQRRFGHVDVNIIARRALIDWVKKSRQSLKVKEIMRENRRIVAEAARASRPRNGKRDARQRRTERVVALYADNHEQLERLCLEEPGHLLRAQMSLITRRIDVLTGSKLGIARAQASEGTSTAAFAVMADPVISRGKFAPTTEDARSEIRTGGHHGGFGGATTCERFTANADAAVYTGALEPSWEDLFDQAMKKQEERKKNIGRAQVVAAASAAQRWADNSSGRPDLAANLVAELRKERERLAELLPIFDARVRQQRRMKEQPVLDMAEALAEARRDAEAQHIEDLRERRRQDDRKKKAEEERLRRVEEQEEERCRILQEELKAQQLLTEQKRHREEIRRQEEEEEWRLHRVMEEGSRRRLEDERRAVERRRAEEAEAERTREDEEAKRHRRVQEGAAEKRRCADEEALKRAEERRAAKPARSRMDEAFEGLEAACGRAAEEESLGDSGEPQDWMRREASSPRPSGGGHSTGVGTKDFLARALAALGEDGESSSDDDWEDGEAVLCEPDSDGIDVELLRASAAIASRIGKLHGAAVT